MKPGDKVEVNIFLTGCAPGYGEPQRSWVDGYEFVRYDSSKQGIIVKSTGVEIHYRAHDVRLKDEIWPDYAAPYSQEEDEAFIPSEEQLMEAAEARGEEFTPLKLSSNQQFAASRIREKINSAHEKYGIVSVDIYPLPDILYFNGYLQKPAMSLRRAVGLALWQEREAFVEFFSATDPSFNADLFRQTCKL